jgi:hypothetical protein
MTQTHSLVSWFYDREMKISETETPWCWPLGHVQWVVFFFSFFFEKIGSTVFGGKSAIDIGSHIKIV